MNKEELTNYKITTEEFNMMRELIYERFGICLSDQKQSMVAGRLQKVLRQLSFQSFTEYYHYLINDKSGGALTEFINNISTNHTYFNRESAHFDFFSQKILPEMIEDLRKRNEHDIRIWDAGCSSGEEAYMIMFLLFDFFASKYQYWDCGLLATDISQRVLDFASKGIYMSDRLNKLPKRYLPQFFDRIDENQWKVKPNVKKEILFRRFNLMSHVFPFKKKFHTIFCRNVMIYFDQPTRERIVSKFHQNIERNGYLIIGLSETLGRNNQWFHYIQPGVYLKK